MLVDERRQKILNITEKSGFVTLQELMVGVASSESTVRRDLEFLDSIGQIRRTRGGAAYIGESLTGFDERRGWASREKRLVAQAAADLIQSGEAVLLDGGTTTLEVARRLVGKHLLVVTNSLPVANVLMNQSMVELLLVGGYLYPKTGVALGPHAVAGLQDIHVRRLVMSVGGITPEGLYNSNTLLVETERRMMEVAEEVVVVSDSSKLGHSALARLCGLEEVDCLVIDSGISPEWRSRVEDAGIKLVVADEQVESQDES
ncbi:MAG: DeoR/GlpR family DNA-binding transcription regulator [Planctomycetaceae bacterium]